MIVLDASAIVAMLLERGAEAEPIRWRVEIPEESIHVPHLMDVEVLHTLRRLALQGNLTPQRSEEALEDLGNIRMTRYAHTAFTGRIWELKHNLTAYDAAYVALAESLAAPLVTLDARLAQAPGLRAPVEVYS